MPFPPFLGHTIQKSAGGVILPGGQTSTWDNATNTAGGAIFSYSAVNVVDDTITAVSGNPTAISTWSVLPSFGGQKWYAEIKITRPSGDIFFGLTNGPSTTYIGNFGSEARALNLNGGDWYGGNTPPTRETGWVALNTGAVVGFYVDEGTGQMWWTSDNVVFHGLGGATTNTASQVIGGTGGWAQPMDARPRGVGVSFFAAGQKAQLLAGSNLVNTPLTGFVGIP